MLVVPRGLQNRCGGLGTSRVGSIPTYSRQNTAADYRGGVFLPEPGPVQNVIIFFTKWIANEGILLYNNNAFLCKNIDTSKERNSSMTPAEELLIFTGLLLLMLLAVRSSLRRRREGKFRDAARKLELVLQPRETIKVICPQKKGRVILTSKRILFDTKEGFNALPVKDIKRVQGNNEKGNRTTSVPKMVSLTIKAEQDYEIKGGCPEFEEFAKQLIKKTTPKKPKKEKTK